MLDAHQGVPTRALRPAESGALTQDLNGKGRDNRSPAEWMRHVDPSPGSLLQARHRTPTGLLRIIEARRKRPDHRITSYNRALEITGCKSIETTLHTRRRFWTEVLIRMSGGRLSKRIVLENLKAPVRRGRGGKEKEWIDCVQSDIRVFRIAGDWKATALEA